jgi:hypothetical protein
VLFFQFEPHRRCPLSLISGDVTAPLRVADNTDGGIHDHMEWFYERSVLRILKFPTLNIPPIAMDYIPCANQLGRVRGDPDAKCDAPV